MREGQNGRFGCGDERPAASWTWFHLIHVTAGPCFIRSVYPCTVREAAEPERKNIESDGEHRREKNGMGQNNEEHNVDHVNQSQIG